jgi:hypothetical protein
MSPSFVFWSFVIKFAAPSSASATLMRYYLTCRYVSFIRCARIVMLGRSFRRTSSRPIIRRHYASRGWRGWWGGGIARQRCCCWKLQCEVVLSDPKVPLQPCRTRRHDSAPGN